MRTKLISVRLDVRVIAEIDSIADELYSENRSYIIDRALVYALSNPPAGGIANYRGKIENVIQTAGLKS